MNTVCTEKQCTGCMACLDMCPKDAITIENSVRFYNAVIDSERCVECGLCHAGCPMNHPPVLRAPLFWKQGWAEDSQIRRKSSSGGLAAAIELDFAERGGVVCSCLFKDGEFIFQSAETKEEVQKFAGSKYVKSNPAGIYKEIKRLLHSERKVLFVGLPCQTAAAKSFADDHENLYTMDLICHGTPSLELLNMFLKDRHVSLDEMQSISFRKKGKYCLASEKAVIGSPGVMDVYNMLFLDSVICTESCYCCPYARQERGSDLTLGDSWGSELSEEERALGISLILCQSQKGMELLSGSRLNSLT